MAGAKNNQILDPPHDAPVSGSIHLALISGVKPSIAEYVGRLLRTIPVAGKNIRAAHDDFLVVAESHFDAGNRWANASGRDVIGIVHGADTGRLGQPVNLQHGNAEHIEIILRLGSERRRSANQGLQILADHFLADGREDHGVGEPQPDRITRSGILFLAPQPCPLGA